MSSEIYPRLWNCTQTFWHNWRIAMRSQVTSNVWVTYSSRRQKKWRTYTLFIAVIILEPFAFSKNTSKNVYLKIFKKILFRVFDYYGHYFCICILISHWSSIITCRDKLTGYLEGIGCRSPSLVFLTAGLSRPFRRLERYGGLDHQNYTQFTWFKKSNIYTGCLQEMERHMEESHPDRGDTQRSVFLYQNLTVI